MVRAPSVCLVLAGFLLASGTASCATGDAAGAGAGRTAPAASTARPAASTASGPAPTAVPIFLSSGGCESTEMVQRAVPAAVPAARAALEELFSGTTPREEQQGLAAFGSPDEPLLRAVRVDAGTAYVDLTRVFLGMNNVSTSCGSGIFISAVENTLARVAAADQVRFAIEGDPAAFYDYMQFGCPRPAAPGDRCDAEPFA